jgi:DNA ligase-1
MNIGRTIYKRDSKGKVREWRMEQNGGMYRTVAGLQEGSQVTSDWTVVEAKNVGRANATTAEEQAASEIVSHYAKKLKIDYHEEGEDIDVAKIFKPMLAAGWDKQKAKVVYPAYTQPKLDGIRCIAMASGLFSRKGEPIVALPHVIEALAPVFAASPGTILDGELYNHDLRQDFGTISSLVRKNKAPVYPYVANNVSSSKTVLSVSPNMAQYHVYDLPSETLLMFGHRGRTLKALIARTLGEDHSTIKVVETLEARNEKEVDDQYASFVEQGYEGGIIRLDGIYEQKRSNSLLKRKDFDDAEYIITGFEEGVGNWSGVAKLVLFAYPDGEIGRATLKGKYAYCQQVLKDAEQYIGKEVTVKYFGMTPAGKCRFPVAKALHLKPRM